MKSKSLLITTAIVVTSIVTIYVLSLKEETERIVIESGLYAKEVKQADGNVKIVWEMRKDLGGRRIAFETVNAIADAKYTELH